MITTLKLMIWSSYLLETMFFIGLAGCATVVILSWISIFKSGFSDEGD